MPNVEANLDQDHNNNQGPVLVILEAKHTIMVITYIMMTPGEGNSHAHPLPLLPKIRMQTIPSWSQISSVLHQPPIVELKTTELVHQNDEPISKNVVPNKIQQEPFV